VWTLCSKQYTVTSNAADIKIIREEQHSYDLLFGYEMFYGNMSWKNVQTLI